MTNPITPQKAQQLLEGYSAEDLEHYATVAFNETGTDLFAAAPRLAATIAAMHLEYAVEVDFMDQPRCYVGINEYGDQWVRDRRYAENAAERHQKDGYPSKIHTRYTTGTEEER